MQLNFIIHYYDLNFNLKYYYSTHNDTIIKFTIKLHVYL